MSIHEARSIHTCETSTRTGGACGPQSHPRGFSRSCDFAVEYFAVEFDGGSLLQPPPPQQASVFICRRAAPSKKRRTQRIAGHSHCIFVFLKAPTSRSPNNRERKCCNPKPKWKFGSSGGLLAPIPPKCATFVLLLCFDAAYLPPYLQLRSLRVVRHVIKGVGQTGEIWALCIMLYTLFYWVVLLLILHIIL